MAGLVNHRVALLAHSTIVRASPDTQAGGGAPAMESRLSNLELATRELWVQNSIAHNRLSCPRSAETALKILYLCATVLLLVAGLDRHELIS